MSVTEPDCFLEEFGAAVTATPGIRNFIAGVFPAQRTFDFVTVEEFERKASEVVRGWVPVLGGKRFHVRLHRRRLKGILSTPEEGRFIEDFLLQQASTGVAPARVGFDDADFVIHIGTIDRRAGLSLLRRDDLARHPFLAVS
jgi:tRNA(Ser,Leu) C12 N-acetylase TAN1